MASESYDFIIVGGGTAGLTLARRLSEDPTQSILVLEAGSDHSDDPRVKTPALYTSLLKTELDWDFTTEPQQNLNLRNINLNQGKALGGSSAINAQVFAPPTKIVIDSWAALGNTGWDWDGLRDYFTKVYTAPEIPEALEQSLAIDGWNAKSHAGRGPVELYYPGNPLHPIRKAWAEAFKSLGYPVSHDPWEEPPVGVAAFSYPASIHPTRKDRIYATNAYYKPVADRTNLHVLTNTTVEKVLFQDQTTTAAGVQYVSEGQTKTAAARKEVIVAAGALQSPKLLELSGIGNEEILKRSGIEVVKHLEGVGENLQDHLMCDIIFEATDDLETLDLLQDPEVLGKAMQEFVTNHTGLLTSSSVTTCAFMPVPSNNLEERRESLKHLLQQSRSSGEQSSDRAKARAAAYHEVAGKTLLDPQAPTTAYVTATVQNHLPPDPDTGKQAPLRPGRHVCIVAVLSQPLSRGSIHVASKDASKDAVVDPKYLTNPVDLEVIAEQLRFIHTIAASPALESVLKQPLKLVHRAAAFDSLDDAKRYVKARGSSMWHPAGACSMLPEDKGGVVDTELKVYGVDKLRVVDASVIPVLPPSTLQSTVYAVAEKAADLIKKEYGLK
ncbi:putative GMC oxidoreductase [Hypoxylon sp. FL0543]|nr:putative GMC oxidoreductase [Hypoxylon sp. FL0543]